MPLLRQAMGGWTARKGCVCMDIMQAILDIEDKAKEIVESADEVKAQQQEKFRDTLEKMQADAKEKTQDEIASLQKTFVQSRKEALEDIEKEYQQKLEKLETLYQSKMDRWVAEITSEIIGK